MLLPKGNYYVNNVENYSSEEGASINKLDLMTYDKLYNGDQWNYYRLSDTVDFKNFECTREDIKSKWPNTICDLYFEKVPTRLAANKKLVAITSIINEKFPIHISKSYVAVHLRLGDAFHFWKKPVSFYNQNFPIDVSQCKNLILFIGLHNHHILRTPINPNH